MTPEEIKRAREICDAATPGPWITTNKTPYTHKNMGIWFKVSKNKFEHLAEVVWGCAIRKKPNNNEIFIAESRTLLPKALDYTERLEAEIVTIRTDCHEGLAEIEQLKAEVAVGRERLGPAGWRLLQELTAAREVIRLAKMEPDSLFKDVIKAIESYDKVKRGE